VRAALGLRPAPEFEDWLMRMGVTDEKLRIRPRIEGAAQKLIAALR
jgi:ethanolamine ammonia-lyase large subunit